MSIIKRYAKFQYKYFLSIFEFPEFGKNFNSELKISHKLTFKGIKVPVVLNLKITIPSSSCQLLSLGWALQPLTLAVSQWDLGVRSIIRRTYPSKRLSSLSNSVSQHPYMCPVLLQLTFAQGKLLSSFNWIIIKASYRSPITFSSTLSPQ